MKLNIRYKKTIVIVFIISIFIFIPLRFIYGESGNINTENSMASEDSPEDTIVYCDYYTWWEGKKWERGNSNNPELGLYDSLNPQVLKEHSRLANEYGIDVFKIEYVPSLDGSIINGILKTDLGNTKVCLMYDTMIRFMELGKGPPPYNFNDSEIYNTFIDDINHIADVYFSNPNYFNINGRPVLWIYITREMCGNWKNAINDARQNVNNKGFNVYLIGDHIYWDYNYDGIELFDGISTYHVYTGGPQNTSEFANRLKLLYSKWKKVVQSKGKDFIPGAIPAYNDTCMAARKKCVPPLNGSKEDFNYMLKIVLNYLDYVNGTENLTQVTIATFNENQEGSGVEPSLEWGYDRIGQIPIVFGNE